MFYRRRPPGTPVGGRFAPSYRQEADVLIGSANKPLLNLRVDAIGHASRAKVLLVDDKSIRTHGQVDRLFPTDVADRAFRDIETFHAALVGGNQPGATSGPGEADGSSQDVVNGDAGWQPGNRPLAEMRERTRLAVVEAVRSLESADLRELRQADAQFPTHEYSRAVESLADLSERLKPYALGELSPERSAALAAKIDRHPKYDIYNPKPLHIAPWPTDSKRSQA